MRGRKWTVRGMTGTLVLLWATGGAGAQTTDLASSKPAASVNGEVITMGQLEAELKRAGQMPVAMPESLRKQQQQIVLEALIDATLMRQFLKTNAPAIDPKELDQRMHDLAEGLEKTQKKSLIDFCRELNQTPQQLRDNMAMQMQWYLYANARITDKQVQQYYLDNKDMFDKVQVHAAEIMFHVSTQAGAAARADAKEKLAKLREKIVKNEIDFAQAAKQYSQGPTKEQGGDLEWFPHVKGVLPEPLLGIAFSLQAGQISEVLETELGVHILKIIERKPGEPSDFNQLRGIARQMCVEEMQQVTIHGLKQSAKIEVYLPR
jgi:peptidyl-prolyl cis-trans isomerase C